MEGEVTVTAMAELLDRESWAIRHGDFRQLTGFAAEKARLLARLERTARDAKPLERLRGRIEYNGRLLRAALEGVAVARQRVAALSRGGAGLETYDSHGKARPLSMPASGVERRA